MTTGVRMYNPRQLRDVLRLLADHGERAKVVAGGTAFTILRRAGLLRPEHVVSLHGIEGLDQITLDDAALRIGALTCLRELERSAEVRRGHPVLAAATGLVANARVRNVATVGGNVVEADPTLDLPAVLAALDAVVHVTSRESERDIAFGAFLTDYFETALRPDELVTHLLVPRLPGDWGGSYLKFVSRSAEDRTCVGIAAFAKTDPAGICDGLRVAAIGVGSVPLRLPAVEEQAVGTALDDGRLAEIATEYVRASDPLSDLRGTAAYRRRMLGTLIPVAVQRAVARENDAVFA